MKYEQKAIAPVIVGFWQAIKQQVTLHPKMTNSLLKWGITFLQRLKDLYQRLLASPVATRQTIQRQLGHSLAGAALTLVLTATPGFAAAIAVSTNVTGINADGNCSLTEAIINANNDAATHSDCTAGSGTDTITLGGNTYSFTSAYASTSNALPQILSEITIEGNSATIERASGSSSFRLLQVSTSGNLTLKQTTISNGSLAYGAGIYNEGTVELNGSTVKDASAYKGGGIWNNNELTISGSLLDNNGASKGGAIYNSASGTIGLMNSTLSENFGSDGGAGIYNHGMMDVTTSSITGNRAWFGSLYTYFSGDSGAGIHNSGNMTIADSTIDDNVAYFRGGGIYNNGSATIMDSTISNNGAFNPVSSGGGIFNAASGSINLTDSTISGNRYVAGGGGISTQGTVNLNNSTVANNSASEGGGVQVWQGATSILNANRSIVSGNTSYSSLGNEIQVRSTGIINVNNHNLFGQSGESNSQAFSGFTPGTTDITATSDGTNPTALTSILNTTLANNGGSTQTHALPSGSPAIDSAPSADCSGDAQNAVARNTNGDGSASTTECDIGAFEAEESTYISLASFNAKIEGNQTLVTWTTAAEIDNAGFNLYRSDSADGPWIKVNNALIPAQGSATEATDYSFTDDNPAAFYMLEDVDIKGVATQHRPVSIDGRLNSAGQSSTNLFLPLIQ